MEWQPISTAPADSGLYVLLWWPYWCYRPVIGYSYLGRWRAEEALSDVAGGPTHWMPLPDPPQASINANGEE